MPLFYLIVAASLLGCSAKDENVATLEKTYPEFVTLFVKNPTNLVRQDAAVVLEMAKIKAKSPDFNDKAFVILAGGKEFASQANDLDGDGNTDQIICIVDFAPNETKRLALRYAKSGEQSRQYPKRTQAELSHKVGGKFVNRKYEGGTFQNVQYLRVPPEHTDHSFYIRYEGPGWESDKVGYRFYLDWRNAIDIFGKKTPAMVLQNVGLDGFDSYHAMADWGMDILKVGESLGIGSLAMWHEGKARRVSQTDSVTCAIVANGAVYSQIQTKYFGWKVGAGSYDVVSDLSITAGSRLTKHAIEISGNPENLCTGIVKLENSKLLSPPETITGWTYLATYGQQSLANDNLGMAVLYRKNDLIEVSEDQYSHVVVLKPESGQLIYYFLAAWEEEPGGIKTAEEFETYLNQTIAELNSPVVIE
ncbi:MAG: DUF4861 domain-containing protein [candidate division KSB1 bacterium]|nr:DUF4861 domain-containing protein [candidate division KSB1 bacterium]